MYSDVFCEVYNAFGWNYYPEIFGQQLLQWLQRNHISPEMPWIWLAAPAFFAKSSMQKESKPPVWIFRKA